MGFRRVKGQDLSENTAILLSLYSIFHLIVRGEKETKDHAWEILCIRPGFYVYYFCWYLSHLDVLTSKGLGNVM